MAYSIEIDRLENARAYQLAVLLLASLSMTASLPALSETRNAASIERGEYIYRLGACESCHAGSTNGIGSPSGAVALETSFGTFNTPNITPDMETGIGSWTDQQFAEAMIFGYSPNSEHYYPAFPFTSYTLMYERDLMDLKAYLDSLPPVNSMVKDHDLSFPFNQRWLIGIWKAMFFRSDPFKQDPSRTASWNRGAYIVNGPGHCAECHTPRKLLGALKTDEFLAGNPDGFDDGPVPAINPALSRPFSQWSEEDIVFSLQTGMLPNGDFFGGTMRDVVENSTSWLNETDLKAIAEYLQSPAIQGSSGFFSSLFGATHAIANKNNSMGHGSEMVFGGFLWLFWLLPIAGLFWLALALTRSKRHMPQEKEAHELLEKPDPNEKSDRDARMQKREDLE